MVDLSQRCECSEKLHDLTPSVIIWLGGGGVDHVKDKSVPVLVSPWVCRIVLCGELSLQPQLGAGHL